MHASYNTSTSVCGRRLCVTLIAALFMLTGSVGCGKTDIDYVKRAKEYQDKGDLSASVIDLKNALLRNPDNPEARWLLGQIYLEQGNGAGAEKELLRAQKLGLSKAAIIPPLGEALLLQRKFRKALDQIEVGAETSPQELAKILRIRGDAELGLENVPSACTLFAQAKDAASDYAPAYLGLAKCAFAREDLGDARLQIAAALEHDPKHGKSWLLLGQLERLQGNLNAAEEALTKAVEADPYDPIALLEHANIALTMDDLESFQQDLAAFRQRNPRHILVNYLQALLDIREGRTEAARDNLEQVVRQIPDHLQSQVLLGAMHVDMGSSATAESILRRVVAKAPGSLLARRLLAQAQLNAGQPERTLETLRPLVSAEKPSVEDLILAGEAYMLLGDISNAKEAFVLAQDREPDSFRTQINLARTSLAGDEVEQALQNLEAAAKIDPTSDATDKLQVMIHLSEQEYDSALVAARRLKSKSPDTAFTHQLIGTAYLGKKDLAAARQAFESALALEPTYTPALLKLADIDVLENQTHVAQRRLEEAVEKNSGDYHLMMSLARLAEHTDDRAQALAWMEKAAEANTSAIEPLESLVRLLTADRQAAKALTVAQEAVQHNPESPRALNLLGAAQMGAGDYKDALFTYQRLAAGLPQSPGSHYRLGLTLTALDRYDEARNSLTTALGLAPDSLKIQAALGTLESQAALGTLESQVGHSGGAVRVAQDLQRTHPADETGYMLEADALMAQGKTSEAVKLYEKAFDKDKTGKTLVRLTQAMDASGRSTEAEVRLLEWLKNHPDDAEVRLHLAAYYDKHGQLQNSVTQYENLARQIPNEALIMSNLANLYQRTGDPRALETTENAFKLEPEQPVVMGTLGWILAQQGQSKRGLELLHKASTKAPENSQLLYYYASALAMAGDKENALASYTKLVEMAPASSQAHYGLAKVEAAMGNVQGMRHALRKAVEIKPDYVDALAALASLELRTGNPEKSLRLARELQVHSSASPIGFSMEGDALMAAKRHAEAARAYQKAIDKNGDNALVVKLHLALMRSGDAIKADDILLTWLKAHPEDETARTYLARSYTKRRLNHQAIEQCEILLSAAPDNSMVLNNLAVLYQEEKDSRALATAEKTYNLRPDIPEFADTLGWILVEQGQTARGVQLLREAAAAAPQTMEIRYHYATALAQSGDKAAALKELQALLSSGKDFPQKEAAQALLTQLR